MKFWRRITKNNILSFPVWLGGAFFVALVLFGLRMVFAGNDTKTIYIFPTKVDSVGWENEENSFEQNLSAKAVFSDFNVNNSGHILKTADTIPADGVSNESDSFSSENSKEESSVLKSDELKNSSVPSSDENVSDSLPADTASPSAPPSSPASSESVNLENDTSSAESGTVIQSLLKNIFTPLFAEEITAKETAVESDATNDGLGGRTATDGRNDPQVTDANDGLPPVTDGNTTNDGLPPVADDDNQDTAVCEIKGKECHTMELSGFGIGGDTSLGEIKNVQLRVSLGVSGEEGPDESDRLFVKYFYKGEWYLADAVVLNKEISNAQNGGHFLYAMPDIKIWDDLSNIKVSLEYDRNSNTKTEVFIDSAWLDVAFKSPDEEETVPEGNVAFDLNTEEVSNNPDILAVSLNEEILFDYRGDAASRGLLIKTDKIRYNGLSGQKVYFSVTNTTDSESTFDLNMYFPENGGEIQSLQKWTRNVPYETSVSEYKPLTYFCEGGWELASTTKGSEPKDPPEYSCKASGEFEQCGELNSDKVNCTVQDTKIGVRKETKYKNAWQNFEVGEKRKENEFQNELQKIAGYFQGKKYSVAVPERAKEIWEGEHLIFPNQTLYFQMEIAYPTNSRGRFYIKASNGDGVALIGPRFDSGWKYRIPVTVVSDENNAASAVGELFIKIDETVSDFWKKVKDDGSDIRFASSEGAEFSYWISEWDSEKKIAGIWVAPSGVSSNSKNTFYLYYGNEKAESESDPYHPFAHTTLRDVFQTSLAFEKTNSPVTIVSLTDKNEVEVADSPRVTLDRGETAFAPFSNSTGVIRSLGPIMAYSQVAGKNVFAPIAVREGDEVSTKELSAEYILPEDASRVRVNCSSSNEPFKITITDPDGSVIEEGECFGKEDLVFPNVSDRGTTPLRQTENVSDRGTTPLRQTENVSDPAFAQSYGEAKRDTGSTPSNSSVQESSPQATLLRQTTTNINFPAGSIVSSGYTVGGTFAAYFDQVGATENEISNQLWGAPQARGAGASGEPILFGDEENSPVFGDIVDINMKIDVLDDSVAVVKDLRNENEKAEFKTPKINEIVGELKDFNAKDKPEFRFRYKQQRNIFVKLFRGIFAKQQFSVKNISLSDPNEGAMDADFDIAYVENGEWSLKMKKSPANFRPGKYTLKIEVDEGGTVFTDEMNFYWGVLAINSNKAVFVPGEEAVLQMAALADNGDTVCNAFLILTITSPDGIAREVPVESQSSCGFNNVTDNPDYLSYYEIKGPGTYKMNLLREDGNGVLVNRIEDSFEVRESVPFIIERIGATRIWPKASYVMKLSVTSVQDFKGQFTETVPKDFELLNINGGDTDLWGNAKHIVWDVDMKAGETKTFSYEYDAPDISPYLYTLGPADMRSDTGLPFTETRTWKLASDATGNMLLLWDTAAYIPTGWTCVSCVSGDPFYQRFIVGSSTPNLTGGSGTHTHSATGAVNASAGTTNVDTNNRATPVVAHTHTYTPTISTASNLPTYRNLVVIQYSSTGQPTNIPTGAIAIFDTSVPSGWTRYSAQDNYFTYGENTTVIGGTGGSATHSHTITGNTGNSATTANINNPGTAVSVANTHNHAINANTSTETIFPPYISVVFGKLNATTTPPNDMIAMWTDTPDTGWSSISGVGGAFENRFIFGSATYGTTGGVSTSTHPNVTGIVSGTPSAVVNRDSTPATRTIASAGHTHLVDVTNFTTVWSLPPYRSVIFAKRAGGTPAATSTFYNIPFDNEKNASSTPALEFRSDDPDGSDELLYQLQWDDDADVATSPLGDCTSDVSCAPHTFQNLTTPADTSPFNDNERMRFRIQTALTNGTTYYWRVRAKDSGAAWGAWSTVQSFTYDQLTSGVSKWHQTEDAQFDQGTYSGTAATYGTNDVQIDTSVTGAMVAYAEGNVTTPKYRLWDGASWGSQSDAADVGERMDWVRTSAATTRNEYIMATMGASGKVMAQIYDGNTATWGNATTTVTTSASILYRGFDVAYESTSGDAVVASCSGADAVYQKWNGTSWTPPALITEVSLGANCQWLQLASDPVSNEIIMVMRSDISAATDFEAVVWNGSAWGDILDLGVGSSNTYEGMAVAYEESGTDAIVVLQNGTGNSFLSSRWDGANWNNIAAVGIGNDLNKAELKSDLGSDRIMLTFANANTDVGYAEWNGAANTWGASSILFANAVNRYTNTIASEYETTAGRDGYVMFAYGDNTNVTERYQVLDRVTPVTAQQNLSSILESSSAFTTRTGDGIILGVFFDDDNDRYDFSYWDAANWSGRQALETDANTQVTRTEPFAIAAQRSASGAGTILSPIIDFDSVSSRTEWGEATWNTTEPASTDVKLQVYYGATCTTIVPDTVGTGLPGNAAGFDATASPLNLSGLSTSTYNQICLKANLTSTSPESPSLDDWTVSWERESYLTQTSFRWYVNDAASLTPSDAWPSGDEFVAEGEKIPFNYAPKSGDVLRLRLAVKDTNAALSAGSADFTLQWAEGTVCSAGLTFADVGASGSAVPWRGYNNASLSDGATLSGRVLGTTDTSETYEEENDTAANPNGIAVNDEGEWDFVIEHNATSSTDYCFRLKNSDGTVLDAYDDYPALVTNAPPSAPTLSAPFTFERLASTTPWFEFSSEDSKAEAIQYEIEVDDDIAFGSPVFTRNSSDNWTEFENQITTYEKISFTSGQLIRFVPPGGLLSSGNTYWWRVRATDPDGSNTWSGWSESWSFTVTSGITISTWHQTSLDQFDQDTNDFTEATSTNALVLTPPNTTGTSTSPTIYYDWKTTGTSWGSLDWSSTTPSGSTLKLHLEYQDSTTGLWALIPDSALAGNSAGFTASTSLLGLDATIYSTIRVYAVFTNGGSGTPRLNDMTIAWGLAVEKPTLIALFDNEKTGTTTPTFRFYSTDPQGNDLQYQISWSSSPTFAASTTRTSGTHSGFANTASSTDISPFVEGDTISFTVQSGDVLTNGNTYWWRVRAIDPLPGGNVWSVWTSARSFTVDTSVAVSKWFQTTDDQWTTDNLNDSEIYGAGNVRLTSLIREALVAYGEGTTAMPKYRLWNGISWDIEKSAETIGERVDWVRTVAAPTRGEYAMATMGQSGKVMAQIYNDTTEIWGNATTTVNTSSNILYRGYDIAYESTSGDAMVASCSGMDAVYQKWDGSAWTAPTTINLSLTQNCQWLQLASDPSSNEIILLAKSDIAAAVDYEAIVWNGTDTWANSLTVGVGSSNAYEAMTVSYEESGTDAIVVIQNSTNNSFLSRRWDGSAPWIDAGTVAIGNDLNKAQLKQDAGSDRLLLTFTNANTDVGYAEWTGSSNTWSASSILFANAVTRYTNSIASEYETTSGRDGYGMFAYGDNTNLTERYQVFDRVTPVTAQQNLSTVLEACSVFTTRTGDGTILGVFFDDDGDRYDVSSWGGSGWSARQAIETNANTLANRPEPLSIVARRYASITSGSVVGSAIDYSDGDGPRWGSLSWNDSTTDSDIEYQLEYYSTTTEEWALIPDADLPYNSVGTSTGPVVLTSLNRMTYGTIRPIANFSCGASCPTLSDWTVAWDAGVTVNGTAKQYDESADVTSGTVAVAVNGVLQFGKTATINGSGIWTMTNVNAIEGDILTFFIEGGADANEAVAVAKYDGTGTMDGVNLFERHLSVGSEDNQTLSNTELGMYDNSVSGDEDIFFDVGDANDDLTVCSVVTGCFDAKLYVKVGNTYRPDSSNSGNITTHDLVIKGSLNADANTIYVYGSWTNNGSFTASAGAVIMRATSTTETIDSNGATSYDFYNLTLGQTSGTATWNLLSALVVSNDLSVMYGTLSQNGANAINIGGNVTIGAAGGWTKGTSDVTFDGSGSKMWTDSVATKQDLGSVVIDGTSKTILLGSPVKATNITIGADDTLDVNANSNNMEITGNWLNNNVFTAQQATVTFSTTTAGHTIFPASSPFYNLTFVGVGGAWAFTTAEATTTYNFTITSGTVTLPNNIFSVGNNFANNGGAFTQDGAGTVKFTATASGKTVKAGGSDFSSILFKGTGGAWTMSDANATTTGDFTVQTGGVTLSSGVLAVGGSFTRPGGTFAHNNGTVRMTSTSAGKSVTPGASTFYNLTFAGTGGEWIITTASPTVVGNFSVQKGSTTLPTGTLTVTGSFDASGGTFTALSGSTVLLNATTTGKTINPGSSPFRVLTLNSAAGGWTVAANATTTSNFNLTAAAAFTQTSGTTFEVDGTFTNGIAGANTIWDGSTLYLNSGAAYSMNTKALGGDGYGNLQIGANTDIKMWNSSSTAYTVDATGSLYSQKHNAASGDLYIWGEYTRSSGTEYWSYATDFDGTALGGSSRIANVRFASGASASFTAGTIQVLGGALASTTIDNQGSGNYAVNISGGTINAQYYQFRNLNASGLNISGTPTVTSLSDGDFEIAVNEGTGITVASSTISLVANNLKQIWNVRFATTTAISATNVTETGAATSNWWFRNAYGNVSGEAFDVDPGASGGNPGYVKWDDSAYTISVAGTVYSLEASSPDLALCATPNVVKIVVDGGTAYSGNCSAVDGTYSIPNVSFIGDAVFTIFLNTNGGTRGVTVTKTPTADLTGIDIYENRVIVRHENTTAITIANMAMYDSSDDADIPFTAEDAVTDTLTLPPDTELHVWDGKTFAPGGNITLNSGGSGNVYDARLHIGNTSVFTAIGSESHSIGGNFQKDAGATFNSASSTFTFTATTTGKIIIGVAAPTFWNVIFNGAGGNWSLNSAITVSNTLTPTAGTISGTGSITVGAAGVAGDGAFNMTGGTATLNSGGNFGGATNWKFYNLTLGNGTIYATTTKMGANSIEVTKVLTIATRHGLLADASTWILSGSNTPFVKTGNLSSETSLFKYTATTSTSVTAASYYQLELSPSGTGSPAYTLLGGNLTTGDTFTIGNGTNIVSVNATTNDPNITVGGNFLISDKATLTGSNSGIFYIGGNYTNQGTFTHGNSTVTMNAGSVGKTITASSSPFYNLTLNNISGGWTVLGDLTTANNFSILSAQSFNVTGRWYDPAWSYRVKISVQNGKVNSDLTNFPVYVDLANLPADFHSHVNANGTDIRVTRSDGVTEVAREVVFYDSATDTGELHFIANLLDASDVDYYIYYGNAAASEPVTTATYGRNNVWTNGYGGVWHMGTATLVDSSGIGSDSTTNTGVATTSSKLGFATDYTPNQQSIIPSNIYISDRASTTLTYMAWVNADAWTRMMEKGDMYFLLGNYTGSGSNGPLVKPGNSVASSGTLSTGIWYQTGGRFSFSGTGTLNAVVNGAMVATTTGIASRITPNALGLYIGSDDAGAYFNGRVDELRISNVVRSNQWISTEYNNHNSPSSFYSTGTETASSAAAATVEVRGTFTNSVGGSATTWSNSTLYLNSGTSVSSTINAKTDTGDTYNILQVGANSDVRMWNSTSTIYSISGSGSLYSQDHNAVDGSLYIWGDYPHSSGNDYWSYATDFDGTALGGSSRTVTVRFAPNATSTFSGGAIEILGDASHPTNIDVQSSGSYAVNVSGGTFNAQYYQFRNMGPAGLNFSGAPTVTTLSNGDFELVVNGGTAMTVAGSVITANPLKTFTGVRFATTTAIGGYNVTATGSTIDAWRFNSHTGNLSGESFDVDPGGDPGYIAWDDSNGAITISGYVYSDEASSVSTVCDGSTPVVRLLVQGNDAGARTASCNGSGFYTFANVAYNPLDVLTVYLNGSSKRAVTVASDPVTNIGDMNLYENRVIVRHQDTFPVTIAKMSVYDSGDDPDIPFTATVGTPNTLVVAPETELHVWTGKTFTPGGNITLQSGGSGNVWDGRLHIDNSASFIATGLESHSVGGSFSCDNGSTFTAANSTFTFTATTTGKTIISVTAPLTFASTTFNGVGGGWTFSNSEATTTGNFTITNGSTTLPTATFSIGGSFANNGGTFTALSGSTVKLTATTTGKTVKGGGSDFSNLLFNGTGGVWAMSDTNATTTNDFTIENGTVTAPAGILSVGGSFQKTGGTFTHNSGTVKFTATSAGKVIFPGNSPFANLLFNGTGGEWAFTTTDATTTATTTVSAGTVTLPSGTFAVGGGFVNSGAFVHNSGTVKMNATTAGKYITAGNSPFNNLTLNGSGGRWTITGNATTSGNFTLTTATAFTQTSGTTLEVDGTFTQGIAGANTTWTGSTLYLNSGTSYSINTKALGGDVYNILKVGANTDIKMWNSSASTYTVDASGSLYSQKHAAASGDLYVFGDYHSSGNEYWSYAKDFDGVAATRTANIRFASGASMTFSAGTFEMVGDATHVTNITNQGSGTYSMNISGGTMNAQYYQFRNMGVYGLNISGTPTITSLSNGDFALASNDSSMMTVSNEAIDQNAGLVIGSVSFATTTAISNSFNVTRTGSTLNAWTFTASTGNYDGESYDVDGADACGAIRWSDSACLFLDQPHYRWRADNGGEGVPASSWYSADWGKRKKIRITNGTGSTLTDFQVKVDVAWDSEMKSDFGDLRFTDSTGTTSINYWIESYVSSDTSTIWLEVPSIPASGSADVYMYYSKSGSVSTTGSAADVFTFYDGFEDDDIDEYSGNTSLFNTGTDFNYEGTYGLDAVGNETQKTTNGLYQTGTTVPEGSTIEYYQYVNATYSTDESCTLFGFQSSGSNYGVCFELVGTDHLALVKDITSNESSGTTLDTQNITWVTGWYRVVIDWLSSNTINVTVYTDAGVEFASTTASDSSYASGGTGFSFWGQHGGWDYYAARQYIATVPTYAFGPEQTNGGATWLAEEDTTLSNQTPGTNLRLRFTVANTGTSLTDENYALEVAPKNAYPNCASVPAVDFSALPTDTVGCGSSAACMKTSSNITNHEATGELLSPPAITTFAAGEVVEDPSYMGNAMNLAQNTHTEMEYNFQLTSNATANAYCFRVSDDGTDLDSYSKIAEVTLLFPPTLSNVKFNNDGPISLTGGATTHITATASTSDLNGFDDFYQATSTFYRSGVSGGSSCVADNNNCYHVASTSCSVSNCIGNTCDLTCGADIYFFAEPTDEGEFVGQYWNADLMIEDDTGLTDTGSLNGVVVMNTLRALTGTNNVNYGPLNVGSTTESTNQTVILTNIGNAPVNVVLEGSDLAGPTGSIDVSEQKYATSTFTYSSCSICQFLTGESVQFDVDLPKPTNTTPVTDNLYWGINIPENTRAETHTGEIRFGVAGI